MQVPLVEDDHVVEQILPHGRNPAFRHTVGTGAPRAPRADRREARPLPSLHAQDAARAGFRIGSLQWLNMFGMPGWWLNARVLKRDRLPSFQMAAYNVLSRVVLPIESWIGPPVGLSLVAVATPYDHERAPRVA